MCECIDIIELKHPEHRVNCTLAFREGEVSRPIISLIRNDTWNPEKRRNRVGSVLATFCPFCGERYAKDADANPAEVA